MVGPRGYSWFVEWAELGVPVVSRLVPSRSSSASPPATGQGLQERGRISRVHAATALGSAGVFLVFLWPCGVRGEPWRLSLHCLERPSCRLSCRGPAGSR